MCCKTKVTPLNYDIAKELLKLSHFEEVGKNRYRKGFDYSQTLNVDLSMYDDAMVLYIHPVISHALQHEDKLHIMGYLFDLANLYAQAVNGRATQMQVISSCGSPTMLEDSMNLLLCDYSNNMPMQFNNVCSGYRTGILERN